MNKKTLRELLGRVESWPKEAQEAAFESLSAIEIDWHDDPVLAEDILRARDDIRHGRLTSQDDLMKEFRVSEN